MSAPLAAASALADLSRPCDPAEVLARLDACGFSAARYRSGDRHLSRLCPDDDAARLHFLTQGYLEEMPVPAGAVMQGIEDLLALPVSDGAWLRGIARRLLIAQLRALSAWPVTVPHERLRALAVQPYFLAGDSQTRAYDQTVADGESLIVPLRLRCDGGTAMGLGRERSRKGFGESLLRWAEAVAADPGGRDMPLLLKFGQMDAEFIWIYRRMRGGHTAFSRAFFEDFADESVASYDEFLGRLLERLPADRVRLCSVTPPVLSDEAWKGGLDSLWALALKQGNLGFLEAEADSTSLSRNLRDIEIPDLDTRIALHKSYNDRLRALCARRGLAYVDDSTPLLGPDGRVSPRFIWRRGAEDPHFHPARVRPVIVELIRRFVAGPAGASDGVRAPLSVPSAPTSAAGPSCPGDPTELATRLDACGFAAAGYLRSNPDLRRSCADEDAARLHFLSRGHAEGRPVPAGPVMQGIERLLDLPVPDKAWLRRVARRLLAAQVQAAFSWSGHPPYKILRAHGIRPVFIAGDSQTAAYEWPVPEAEALLLPLRLRCEGASAIGLGREGSRLGHGERLLRWAETVGAHRGARAVPVLLKFGQVDAEFAWIFRRLRDGRLAFSRAEFEAFADESVAFYGGFLAGLLRHLPPERVRLCSVFPPSLSDAAWARGLAAPWAKGMMKGNIGFLRDERNPGALLGRLRDLEIPDLATRTALNAAYNERLRALCARHGITFLDDFTPLLGSDGCIGPAYLGRRGSEDFHLSAALVRPVIAPLVRRAAVVGRGRPAEPSSLHGGDCGALPPGAGRP